MIRVYSESLSKEERQFLQVASHWCLDKFVAKDVKDAATVSIHIRHIPTKYGIDYSGYVVHQVHNGKQYFKIEISDSLINVRSRKNFNKLKKILSSLFHELVHVKQYLNKELYDYADGDVKFCGQRYPHVQNEHGLVPAEYDESYYNSPWEVEAYGRQDGLVNLFKKVITVED